MSNSNYAAEGAGPTSMRREKMRLTLMLQQIMLALQQNIFQALA